MDSYSAARLVGLHPAVIYRFTQADAMLEPLGIILRIEQNPIRSWAAQETEWEKGRTLENGIWVIADATKVTTHAPPGKSWHQSAMCEDNVPLIGGVPDWNASDATWQKIYQVMESVGMRGGKTFSTFAGDADHFQPVELPLSPTDEDVQVLRDGGIQAIWEKYATVLPVQNS